MTTSPLASSFDPRFGGKATGLAHLKAAGVPVPDGFAIAAGADLGEVTPLLTALLARGPIAVRSSAVGEDGATASFAGQFTSYLDVRTLDDAVAAIHGCIASARNVRVAAYAGATGVAAVTTHAVGVVCQSMIPARAAGVCFTADPEGRDAALIVEAVSGLGEGLVSGHVSPDRWRVYRTAFGTWEAQRDDRAGAAAIDEREAVRIADTAARVARARGCALDLEWALDAEELWWLQARPITALRAVRAPHVEKSAPDADDGPLVIWSNWNVRETMPDPASTLTWGIWRDLVPRVAAAIVERDCSPDLDLTNAKMVDRVDGRLVWNLNAFALAFGPRMLPLAVGMFDAEAARTIHYLYRRGLLRARKMPLKQTVLGPLRVLRAFVMRVPLLASMLPRGRGLRAMDDHARRLARDIDRDRTGLSDGQLVDELEASLFRGADETWAVALTAAAGVAGFAVARGLLADFPDAAFRVGTGLADTPTTQISVGLDELIAAARPHAELFAAHADHRALTDALRVAPGGAAWLAQLDAFLVKNGQRCPGEFEIALPRWGDDPSKVFELVRTGLRAAPGEPVRARLARLARERDAAIGAAVRTMPWWKRALVGVACWLVEAYIPLREAPKHTALVGMRVARQMFLELGRRFTERHLTASPEDVFWLDVREIEAHVRRGAALPSIDEVARRRAEAERFRGQAAPDVRRSDGVPVPSTAPAAPTEPGTYRGTPISVGSATGRVRVVHDPENAALEPGEVLVVRAADPGWTPLFPRAAAIVLECGGLMCHAAVVARELGIPTVSAIANATGHLTDGMVVTVDGAAGTVRINEDASR